MKQIRIFTNSLGLRALAVWDEDLYSFRLLRGGLSDEEFSRRVEGLRLSVPHGFREIGSLVEVTQVTFRFLRDGSYPEELALPDNLHELGFEFDESKAK